VRPAHAVALNAVFTPSADELARASAIVEGFDAARKRGEDRAQIDGLWIEVPTYRNGADWSSEQNDWDKEPDGSRAADQGHSGTIALQLERCSPVAARQQKAAAACDAAAPPGQKNTWNMVQPRRRQSYARGFCEQIESVRRLPNETSCYRWTTKTSGTLT